MIQLLRSISITETSTLIRVGPPLCPASVLSLSWVFHFEFLPLHRSDRFPRSTQGPGSGSRHLHAGRRPSSKQVLPWTYPGVVYDSSFDVIFLFSTPHQWFACARLPEPHLTPFTVPFPTTLTTRALNPCSLRRFEACSCTPAPRGLFPHLLCNFVAHVHLRIFSERMISKLIITD